MRDRHHRLCLQTTPKEMSCNQGGGRSIAIVMIGILLLSGVFVKVFFLDSSTEHAGAIRKNDTYEVMVQLGLSSEEISRIPDVFYREDIPSDIVKKLPPGIIETVPTRLNTVKK